MAKTLTVAGTNFMPFIKTNSAEITEVIQSEANSMMCEFVFKDPADVPSVGSEIIYKDGSRFLFGGFISAMSPVEFGKGGAFVYDVEATDYTYLMNNKIARRAYSNATLKTIVEDLIGTYAGEYNFTTTNVETGPTLASITFDHISLRQCFEKIAKRTGYVWWIDYEKNVYFQSQQTDTAPEDLRDSLDNHLELAINYDTSQVRNAVIVIGSELGEQSSSTSVETFTGDGETRSWTLVDRPSNVVSIKVNGVAQQFSLDVNERDTDNFIYSFSGASFRQTAGETTLTGSDTIEIEYNPRIPIVARRVDQNSITTLKAFEGGDGIHEYTIKEASITSRAEAIERADQELAEFADPLVNGIFKTRSGLLQPGSVFAPGQILTVNLPSYMLPEDTALLIQEVKISMVEDEDGATTEYFYEVKFGGKIVSIEKFLQTLANETEEVTDVDEIITIEGTNDEMRLADATPTDTLTTPPFKWSPGTPTMVWGLFEWKE